MLMVGTDRHKGDPRLRFAAYKRRLTGMEDGRSLICHEMASVVNAGMHERFEYQAVKSLAALQEQERRIQVCAEIK